MYEEAVAIYQTGISILAKDKEELNKFFKKDLIEKEATIYSNIAACYKQS